MTKYYTEDDLFYLETNWGRLSIKTIANNLGRTEIAIKKKAYKLGLGGPLKHKSFLLVTDIVEVLGVELKTVYRYIDKCGLKSGTKHFSNRRYTSIQYKDLIHWLTNNKECWNACRVNRESLIAMGMDINELDSKIKKDMEKRKRTTFTKEDIKEIKILYKKPTRIKEIAIKLDKEFNSVKWMIYKLILSGELESNKGKSEMIRKTNDKGYGWEEWQDKMLISEFRKGTLLKDIAIMVGKSYDATKNRNKILSRRMMKNSKIKGECSIWI